MKREYNQDAFDARYYLVSHNQKMREDYNAINSLNIGTIDEDTKKELMKNLLS